MSLLTTESPAVAAARRRLHDTQTALAAALRGEPDADPGPEHGSRPDDTRRHRTALIVQLADHALGAWAERRPWTLMALAAGAGALLASRRGRSLVGALAGGALVALPASRQGWQVLGHGLSLWLPRRTGPPT